MQSFTSWDSELYHHGILGMKWGRRRYQNEDGTLTEAGKARYGKVGDMSDEELDRAINRLKRENELKDARRGGRSGVAGGLVKAASKYIEYRENKRQQEADEKKARLEYAAKMKELGVREKEAVSRVKEAEQKTKAQEQIAKQAEASANKERAQVDLYKTSAKRKEAKAALKAVAKQLSGRKKYKLIKKLLGDKDYKNTVETLVGAKMELKVSEARKAYYLDPKQFMEGDPKVITYNDNSGDNGSKKKNK